MIWWRWRFKLGTKWGDICSFETEIEGSNKPSWYMNHYVVHSLSFAPSLSLSLSLSLLWCTHTKVISLMERTQRRWSSVTRTLKWKENWMGGPRKFGTRSPGSFYLLDGRLRQRKLSHVDRRWLSSKWDKTE